jgi:hypothetical protein
MLRQFAVALPHVGHGVDGPRYGDGDGLGFDRFGLAPSRTPQAGDEHRKHAQPANQNHPAQRDAIFGFVAMADKKEDERTEQSKADDAAKDTAHASRGRRGIAHGVPSHFPCTVGLRFLARAQGGADRAHCAQAERPIARVLRTLIQDERAKPKDWQANQRVTQNACTKGWLVHWLNSANRALPLEAANTRPAWNHTAETRLPLAGPPVLSTRLNAPGSML